MDFCGIIYEILPFSGNILNILIMSGVCIGIQKFNNGCLYMVGSFWWVLFRKM